MRYGRLFFRLCLLVIGFSLTTTFVFAQVKPIELRYAMFFPTPHKHTLLLGDYAKEIEKRTNGRVKIVVYSGATLTPADKTYDAVEKGIADLGLSCPAYTRGKFPLTEVIDLPLGYKSAMAATRLVNEYLKKFKPKEFDSTKIMYFHGHGPGFFHTKKPVNKLEELKGMKIRCTGLAAKIAAALGAAPVAMPMTETYDSLTRGVVEGSMAPYEALEGWKWGEVIKSTTESFGSAYTSAFFVVMNKDKWNALPPDIQAIFEKVNEEWIEKSGRLWDEIDKAGKQFSLGLGNKAISLSQDEDWKWAKAVKPLYDDYVKMTKERGLPGDEAFKFCLETLYKTQK